MPPILPILVLLTLGSYRDDLTLTNLNYINLNRFDFEDKLDVGISRGCISRGMSGSPGSNFLLLSTLSLLIIQYRLVK